jgi:O-acetylserine/cysteine efflux transporter
VVVIWGLNFVVMKVGLAAFSPMLLGALRFALASVPLLLMVRRPQVPWRFVVGYGLLQGVGQFGLLFTALHLGMPAGLASMVLQAQVFFTALLAALVLGERTRTHQWVGLLVAACGLALIGSAHGNGSADMTLVGFMFTVAAALSWAGSNVMLRLMSRRSPHYEPFGFIVWSSAVPVLPFIALAFWFDGVQSVSHSLATMQWPGVFAVCYLAFFATLVGYALWTGLFKRHPAGRVAPFSLLVPVIGLAAARYFLDERLNALQWAGAALVVSGLLVNQFGARTFSSNRPAESGA